MVSSPHRISEDLGLQGPDLIHGSLAFQDLTTQDGTHRVRKSKSEGLVKHRKKKASRKDSEDLNLGQHVTEDFVVDGILSSFDRLPSATPSADTRDPQQYPTYFDGDRVIKGAAEHTYRSLSTPATRPTTPPLAEAPPPIPTTAPSPPSRPNSRRHNLTQTLIKFARPSTDLSGSDVIPPLPGQQSSPAQQRNGHNTKEKSHSKDSSTMDQRPTTGGDREVRSPSPTTLKKARRRSRSLQLSSSMLDRARPVPGEYHDFHDTGAPLQSSMSSNNMFTRAVGNQQPSPGSNLFTPNRAASQPLFQHEAQAQSFTPFGGSNMNAGAGRSETPVGRTEPPPVPSSSTKEKPGFLKRFFGSSKTSSVSQKGPPQLPPFSANDAKKAHEANAARQAQAGASSNEAPMEDNVATALAPRRISMSQETSANHTAQPGGQKTLKEKTSFFRRKKKQTSDELGAPPDASEMPSSPVGKKALQSPSLSSLRKVMDPFLNENPAQVSPRDKFYDSVESQQHGQNETPDTRPGAPSQQRSSIRVVTNSNSTQITDQSRPSTSSRHPPQASSAVVASRLHDQERSSTVSNVDREFVDAYDAGREASLEMGNAHSKEPRGVAGPPKNKHTANRQNTYPEMSAKTPQEAARVLTDATNRDWQDQSNSKRIYLRPTESEEALADQGETASPTVQTGDVNAKENVRPTTIRSPISDTSLSMHSLSAAQSRGNLAPTTSGRTTPGFDYFDRARRTYDDHEDPITNSRDAAGLGEAGPEGDRYRGAYFDLFDFNGLNILLALRDLCKRLVLKGETQQVDRVLSAFSERWVECNPSHGFKSSDVVHTICYSLLLLNTDLHVADMDQKMTKNQFLRNTLPTIKRVAEEDDQARQETIKAGTNQSRGGIPWQEGRSASPASLAPGDSTRPSVETRTDGKLSARLSQRPMSGLVSLKNLGGLDSNTDIAELLVNSPYEGTTKGWETTMENILKDFYTSIRQLRLPLFGVTEGTIPEGTSSQNLSVNNALRRTGSIVSKSPSELSRGRPMDARSTGSRWSSRNRTGRPKMYAASGLGSSFNNSRTSLEEPVFSPSGSSTWSRSMLGQTQSTMSTDSLGSRLSPGDASYSQSIGFASALSHAIIREEGSTSQDEEAETAVPQLEDPQLELAGAPWAKEGIVHHKHHCEAGSKKAKNREWTECFVVVEKGWMRLFDFGSKSSAKATKSASSTLKGSKKGAGGAPIVVGGGNWMDNMEPLREFMLRQTYANPLPPPGYSKIRPHVFALSLPDGAVHLFSVGTSEIMNEFYISCNYWSARLSKEPLVGGVSNVEYGWSESIINPALLQAPSRAESSLSAPSIPGVASPRGTTPVPPGSYPPSSAQAARNLAASPAPSEVQNRGRGTSVSLSVSGRPSLQGSMRSSIDQNYGSSNSNSVPTQTAHTRRPSLSNASMRGMSSLSNHNGPMPGDKIALAEWMPPTQTLYPSNLTEDEQLAALRQYVANVEEDLIQHNDLRHGMALAYTPRSANAQKALSNWEKKSSYLLREIVKFGNYCETLAWAAKERDHIANSEPREGAANANLNGMRNNPATAAAARGAASSPDSAVRKTTAGVMSIRSRKSKGSMGSLGEAASSLGEVMDEDLDEGTKEALRMAKMGVARGSGRERSGSSVSFGRRK